MPVRWPGRQRPQRTPARGPASFPRRPAADDGLLTRIPAPDVALAQHVLRGVSGTVGTHSGPFLSAADNSKITVYGRGGHGSMPQNTIDPVVLAAMIVVRLQTVVSREIAACFLIRLAGIRYNINAPIAPEAKNKE